MVIPSNCPAVECWQALFDDSLPAQARARYKRHLETCPTCQARLDHAAAHGDPLLRLARQMGDPTLSPPDVTLAETQERILQGMAGTETAPPEEPDLFFLGPI